MHRINILEVITITEPAISLYIPATTYYLIELKESTNNCLICLTYMLPWLCTYVLLVTRICLYSHLKNGMVFAVRIPQQSGAPWWCAVAKLIHV